MCYKLAFGLNGAGDALKARREDYLSPGLIFHQSRRLKWGLILWESGQVGAWSRDGTWKKEQKKILFCFLKTRSEQEFLKRAKQPGNSQAWTHTNTHEKLPSFQCTVCNINVRELFLCCVGVFLMCRDVSDTTTFCKASVTQTNNSWLAWIMQLQCFHPPQNICLVNKLLMQQDVCVNNRYSNQFSWGRLKLWCKFFIIYHFFLLCRFLTPLATVYSTLLTNKWKYQQGWDFFFSHYAMRKSFFYQLTINVCHKLTTRLSNIDTNGT